MPLSSSRVFVMPLQPGQSRYLTKINILYIYKLFFIVSICVYACKVPSSCKILTLYFCRKKGRSVALLFRINVYTFK